MDHMGNFSREMETIWKSWIEMLEIRITAEVNNVYDRLISRLDTAGERICELQFRVIEITYTETQWEKEWVKKARIEHPRGMGQYKKSNICLIGIPVKRENEEKIFEEIMAETFSKLMTPNW